MLMRKHPQHTRKNLLSHQRAHRSHRLGPRRSLGPDHAPKILHSLRGARQDGQDMDQRPRASERLETDPPKVRRGLMEGELEPERERLGCQRGRQQGHLMEREPQRGMGLRQDDRGVDEQRVVRARRWACMKETRGASTVSRWYIRGVGRDTSDRTVLITSLSAGPALPR